ncbi:hypothetical protein [Streptococcus suis]
MYNNDTQVANYVKKIDWKKVAVTAGAIGVGIVLTVATGGLGAPVAMAIGGVASGAIISGYDAYSSGQRGWALAGSTLKGAGLGAITGFVGGQFIGAGANVAANVSQNIANQTVRHVVTAGVEAGVETVIDTGISVATGNPISLKNVVTDYGLNLVTNGSGSVSSKKSAKADIPKNKPKSGDVSIRKSPKDVTPVQQLALPGPKSQPLALPAPQNVTAGTYRSMSKSLRGTDYQAHHVNQAAMMKKTVPNYSYSDGVAVPLVGNIRTDVGSPHYNAHATMEAFYDQYRRGGDKFGDIPTVGDYNVATKASLRNVGVPSQQVDSIMTAVEAEQRYYGLTDKSDIVIPGRISLPRK